MEPISLMTFILRLESYSSMAVYPENLRRDFHSSAGAKFFAALASALKIGTGWFPSSAGAAFIAAWSLSR
jgi:hypothetical protein